MEALTVMTETKTDRELQKAFYREDTEIHLDNKTLCAGLIARSRRYKRLLALMRIKGYKMIAVKCFGAFDVRFVKKKNTGG